MPDVPKTNGDPPFEGDLRRALEELRQADRRKDEFLATLSHELRTPLAPLANALDLLRTSAHDPAVVAQARDIMERQLLQMVRLVDDLLDITRIRQGKLVLRKSRTELGELIARAVEMSRPLIAELGHDLTVEPPDGPVHLEADPFRITQIVQNLLANAAKYTEEGGRIWLTVDRGLDEVVIRVKDSGIGISSGKLPHVFELFAQANFERARGGLGVGLALVKQLTEMHGGKVEAASEGLGLGSQFTVRLPIRE